MSAAAGAQAWAPIISHHEQIVQVASLQEADLGGYKVALVDKAHAAYVRPPHRTRQEAAALARGNEGLDAEKTVVLPAPGSPGTSAAA